jgi:ATP-dependent Clp protease ATP-binding subunit ClpC
LQNLEKAIQTRIVGQANAVSAVADALRRARSGLHSGKRPIGSFLFLGPTGVGKTEMAKTIAALYYKNEKAFIRIDMSEYQSIESFGKLIGTKDETGILTTSVTDQPYSVILLDEVEKAGSNVRNIFLQILDDGFVTNGFGQKVDFTSSMVIATSNAGSELIRQTVNQGGTLSPDFKPQLLDYLQSNGIFSAEWLNRFDAIIIFLPLTPDEIRQVAKLMVSELVNQVKSHNIELIIEDDVYDVLVERGYDPEFGARPMRRAIQDTIESALAKQLLSHEVDGLKKIVLTKAMIA